MTNEECYKTMFVVMFASRIQLCCVKWMHDPTWKEKVRLEVDLVVNDLLFRIPEMPEDAQEFVEKVKVDLLDYDKLQVFMDTMENVIKQAKHEQVDFSDVKETANFAIRARDNASRKGKES